LLDQLAIAGYTMWTWDLFDPRFWNMKDAGGLINGAVSPAGHPSYGAGGLAAGHYVVQGCPSSFTTGATQRARTRRGTTSSTPRG
jgi:hypothetical protein